MYTGLLINISSLQLRWGLGWVGSFRGGGGRRGVLFFLVINYIISLNLDNVSQILTMLMTRHSHFFELDILLVPLYSAYSNRVMRQKKKSQEYEKGGSSGNIGVKKTSVRFQGSKNKKNSLRTVSYETGFMSEGRL